MLPNDHELDVSYSGFDRVGIAAANNNERALVQSPINRNNTEASYCNAQSTPKPMEMPLNTCDVLADISVGNHEQSAQETPTKASNGRNRNEIDRTSREAVDMSLELLYSDSSLTENGGNYIWTNS